MSKRREQAASSSTPWTLYLVVIGVAAFGAGIVFDQMVLRSPEPPQAVSMMPQQQASARIAGAAPAQAPPTGLSPAERAVALGNQDYDQQNWSGAITEYERAISLGSDTPDVRTDLGNAYRFSGNPQKAREQYEIAQRQNPSHEQSLFNQGALYAQSLGDPATAMAKWREFIARFPSSPRAADARRLLGELEAQFGTPMQTKP